MGLCLLMPVDVIGLGLSQRPGNPQALELSHPPFMHQTLTGLRRTARSGVEESAKRKCGNGGEAASWFH
jgi:hypothetical protein